MFESCWIMFESCLNHVSVPINKATDFLMLKSKKTVNPISIPQKSPYVWANRDDPHISTWPCSKDPWCCSRSDRWVRYRPVLCCSHWERIHLDQIPGAAMIPMASYGHLEAPRFVTEYHHVYIMYITVESQRSMIMASNPDILWWLSDSAKFGWISGVHHSSSCFMFHSIS